MSGVRSWRRTAPPLPDTSHLAPDILIGSRIPTLILEFELYNRRMLRLRKQNDGTGIRNSFSFRAKMAGAIAVFALALCSTQAGVLRSPRGSEVFNPRPAIPQPSSKTIRILWNYAVASQTPDLVFKVYHSYDARVALRNWALLTNVPGTARSVTVPMNQPQEFFTLTASNYLGESRFAAP